MAVFGAIERCNRWKCMVSTFRIVSIPVFSMPGGLMCFHANTSPNTPMYSRVFKIWH